MVNGETIPAVSVVPPSGTPRKDPLVSAIVSLFIPGLGQIINGQVKKGIIFFVGYFVAWVVIVILWVFSSTIAAFATFWAGGFGMCCCIPVLFLPLLVNVYAAYDAHKTATEINSGVVVEDWLS